MTQHDKNIQALAARIQNLPPVDSSPWRNYIPLAVLFLCLLVFDTETWKQRALLCFLTLVGAFLISLLSKRFRAIPNFPCSVSTRRRQEAEFPPAGLVPMPV